MTEKRQCKDCLAAHLASHAAWVAWGNADDAEPQLPRRPAPHPGPRCATHDRVERKRVKSAAHDRKVQVTYGLNAGDYERLYAFQNGTCALCRRATGKSKRLAVDHDHKTGTPRGLLCGPCNQLLGHGRDDPAFFQRIIAYLGWPPYAEMMWLKPQDPPTVTPSRSGGLEYTVISEHQAIWMHRKADCEAPCAVHAPSDHHMKEWPLEWRDEGKMERQCQHGIGHPDPDDLAYRRRHGQNDPGIHGCDLCCIESAWAIRTAEELGLEAP